MTTFRVQPDTLELISQLAQRQAGHLAAIKRHLDSHTAFGHGDGLIMLFLTPMYNSGRDNAMQGFDQGITVCETVAEVAQESKEAYLEADEECRAALEETCAESGIDVPPAPPPGGSAQLPPAQGLPPAPREDDPSSAWDNLVDHSVSAIDTTRSVYSDIGKAGGNSYVRTVMDRTPLDEGVQQFHDFRFRQPFDNMVRDAVDQGWERADDRWGQHGATSTLRERFEQRQAAAWGENYHRGLDTTSNSQVPSAHPWVQDNMSTRTFQAGQDVAGLYGQGRGAYDAITDAVEAEESLQHVQDVADGPDNTAAHDWAQNR